MKRESAGFICRNGIRKLVRFMTGKCVDLRSNKAGGSLDNDFYKDILLRRQQAFDKALAERMQELSDDEGGCG